MYFYQIEGVCCCAQQSLPYEPLEQLPDTGSIVFLSELPPEQSRSVFAITHPAQLFLKEESVALLNQTLWPQLEPIPQALLTAIAEGRVRGVNRLNPHWKELLHPVIPPKKRRLNLLAVGDVGSTLLMGIILTGGDVVDSIGICDLNPNVTARWEYELNQIAYPWDYDRLPTVEAISFDQLFDGDVAVFCATKSIPAVGAQVADVRMAQFEANAQIMEQVAKKAREKKFKGLFAVVSDPVDPLCRVAFTQSNTAPDGSFDLLGLQTHQIQGYGLGVMNARAAFYAKRDNRFASFLTEGRSFGPHGGDLVVANSIEQYDDVLSKELTELAVKANLKVREVGFKPYVAPAFSSGALSILLTLRGEWHCSSTFMGGIFMGAKNRFSPMGLELEALPLPQALFARIEEAAENLKKIQ